MLRTFLKGIVFGLGFVLAVSVVNVITRFKIRVPAPVTIDAEPGAVTPDSYNTIDHEPQFHKLSLDDQIERASVIVRTEYIDEVETLVEVLKHKDGVDLYYSLGDEFDLFHRGRGEDIGYGDGNIVFMVGSPAEAKLSISYNRDRLASHGNMPLEMFREKCGT